MSVNFGGSLPVVPGNLNEEGGPQQPSIERAAPTMSAPVASSPLAPVRTEGALASTEPAFSTTACDMDPAPSVEAFAAAVEAGQVDALRRMLDLGVSPLDEFNGVPLLVTAMIHLQDAALLHKMMGLLDPMQRKIRADVLFAAALKGMNGVALDCLLKWRVSSHDTALSHLAVFVVQALKSGSPELTLLALRISSAYLSPKAQNQPTMLQALGEHCDVTCLKLFTARMTPNMRSSKAVIADLLKHAVLQQKFEFVAELIAWLQRNDAIPAGFEYPLDRALSGFDGKTLCLLASAGYPFSAKSLHVPEDTEIASGLQRILFGENLDGSPLGQLRQDGTAFYYGMLELMQPGYVNIPRERQEDDDFPDSDPEDNRQFCARRTVSNLFLNGFCKPVAEQLAQTLKSVGDAVSLDSPSGRFTLIAMLNEWQASSELSASDDALVRGQFALVMALVQEGIHFHFGSPEDFFVEVLSIVRPGGEVELPQLRFQSKKTASMPDTIISVLQQALQDAIQHALDLAVPLNTGMTQRQVQVECRKHMLVNVFKWLVKELPVRMQSRELTSMANRMIRNDEIRIAQHFAITVLADYCRQLTDELDTASERIWQRLAPLFFSDSAGGIFSVAAEDSGSEEGW